MANANIKDIAEIAGVAISTVSRVINNHPDVSEETRKKVMEIIEEINYIPNNSARNLKRSNSTDIGVLVKGIYNPFFAKIVQSIEEEVAARGYTMILHYNNDHANDIEAAIEFVKEKKLKGLICLGGNFSNLQEAHLEDLDTPLVLASTDLEEDRKRPFFSSVTIENEKAAYEAVDYLCRLGHKKIGIITTGEEDQCVGNLRLKGFRKAIAHHGISYDENYKEIGEYTFESGFDALNRLVDRVGDLTAIFVTSDIMAIGAAKAILNRGLRIPEDISVMGFDGIDYAKFFHPSLTTVNQPGEYMGKKSADILFDIIMNNKAHQHIILKTELLESESCKKLV
ncbi:transcriptional regulator, LacI family [Geosporobacter subterraneus DSM 17957]|uniref:Transcriptional regulator, LacI family n=1 Tax=Geosporobacter subterraneus DSM 17957 TaxID=1121919 RepID=A0A1M6JB69_9FIRM|nr:LacI family DNA-binding transcriptional regulator [Geosporobacter subterraneus]SHJ43958.1 transcriptional regulator, LacI family [Geosporobacter subterraneus DSM 17957]